MMKFFVFALALVAAQARLVDYNSEEEKTLFDGWMNEHEKVYTTESARSHAYENFQLTLNRIETLNAKSDGAVFGLGPFSDLSTEEFEQQYLMSDLPPLPMHETRRIPMVAPVPSSFDWRNKGNVVTPVKNQGQCGSCWAFSATEAIESAWIMANNSVEILAPQQIVDCDTADNGCGGGWPYRAYAYVEKAGGLETNANYPYTARDGSCKAVRSKEVVQINGYKDATRSDNEQEMQTASFSVGPLSICVATGGWQDYNGGVLTKSQCGSSVDHCVMATGWNTGGGDPYWIVRNSWGGSWGLSGYIHLHFGDNTCNLASAATYPTV